MDNLELFDDTLMFEWGWFVFQLAADEDVNVRNGTELLDKLMQDTVAEHVDKFDVSTFVPLLTAKIKSSDKQIALFLVKWVSLLLLRFAYSALGTAFEKLSPACAENTHQNIFMQSAERTIPKWISLKYSNLNTIAEIWCKIEKE